MFPNIFFTRNESSFLSKWLQLSNTSNEFHFGVYHVNGLQETDKTPN